MTAPVPSASASGRLRFGFLTSPAVKVTLFQASAENSEPTCATARIVSRPTNAVGPPTPTCTAWSVFQPGVTPEIRAEVRGDGLGIASQKSRQHQAQQRGSLGEGEDVLDHRSGLHAEDIDDREEDHDDDGNEILRVEADIHVAQHHGPNGNWRDVRNVT